MRPNLRRPRRSGNILVLAAVMMVAMFGILAFAVDLGYVQVVRAQLQRSADAAAIAATWDLIDDGSLSGQGDAAARAVLAMASARSYARSNPVAGDGASLAESDITIGYLSSPADTSVPMSFSDPSRFNAVQVRVRRTADQNGEVPLFFARVLGVGSQAGEAVATAAFLNNIGSLTTPSGGGNLEILPFALDKTTWDGMIAGGGSDDWTWDPATGQVRAGSDGIREVNLYPQGTGSPGNRGTVNIGDRDNGTNDLVRQILHGLSQEDLASVGGELRFDAQGELRLEGDPGISAGMKDDLASIKGQPRIIPVFSAVSGNGGNAQYVVVMFVGARIMDVKLTGSMSSKRVIVQPANITTRGGGPATDGTPHSQFVYSPVWLVR